MSLVAFVELLNAGTSRVTPSALKSEMMALLQLRCREKRVFV
jgi:hypothetical protein